jgi:hypothetical protein
MSIRKLFIRSLGLALRKRGLAVRLWAVNFLFSLLVVAPFAFIIHDQLAHSLAAGPVLARLDVTWLTDLSTRYWNAAPAFLGLLLLAVLLYMLLTVWLNGGVIGCLDRPAARTTLADFFHDCGRYFWRFFRLFLLSIPVYLAVLGIFYSLILALLNMVNRRAPGEWPALIVRNLRLLALVLLLAALTMFFDYVKIGLVTGAREKVLKEAWLTLQFIGQRFFKAWGLYLLAGLVFIALTGFYLEIARLLPKDRPLLVLLMFLWQQAYILCRQWSKLLFYATEIEFVRQQKKREE